MALNPNQSRTFHAAGTATSAELDAGLRSYMLKVYNYMALGVAFTGLAVLAMASMPQLTYTLAVGPGKWLIFAALLGMGWFSPKIMTMRSVGMAQAYYWVYCALWAVMISPMVLAFLNLPGGVYDIARAFFITAGSFAGLSIFGYVTKRNLAPIAAFAMMAIIGLVIAGFVHMIFFEASTTFSLMFSCAAVLLFAIMTAYETQQIKNMYSSSMGEGVMAKTAIFGALQLYGSFVVMFIHILNIIGIMRE